MDSLTASRDFSRRDVVRTSVGSGFAAAVLPEAAQTLVKTDTTGLLAGEVSIPVGDFKLPAYRAAPAGVANAPGISPSRQSCSCARSTPRATPRLPS